MAVIHQRFQRFGNQVYLVQLDRIRLRGRTLPKLTTAADFTAWESDHAKFEREFEKVVKALDLVRQRDPELTIDGEFQADAAVVHQGGHPPRAVLAQARKQRLDDLVAQPVGAVKLDDHPATFQRDILDFQVFLVLLVELLVDERQECLAILCLRALLFAPPAD